MNKINYVSIAVALIHFRSAFKCTEMHFFLKWLNIIAE